MSTLVATGVTKRFGALTALDSVSATFRPGRIHAVLGENGAGKSTLMNVLSGFLTPDDGLVELDGRPIPAGRPFAVKRLGIEMIHQHFTLVPEFTVAENLALVRLGDDEGIRLASRVAERSAKALQIAKSLGWNMDPSARIRTLGVGTRQRIEILKALSGDAQVLIFDEPTAVLAPDEVDDLLGVLRRLRDEGRTVVLIAHKLSEVMAIADEVTVLRRGRYIASAEIPQVTATHLAEWMVGELPAAQIPVPLNRKPGLTATGIRVRGDRGEEAVRGVDLRVDRGEIVGIGGVDGNGQVELAEALAGVRKSTGSISFEGSHPHIAYIPQDRQMDGLAMGMSVEDNLLVTGHQRADLTWGPWLRSGQIREWAKRLIQQFEIKVSGPESPVASLSGGNQQKVVVSRNLDQIPDLLIVLNPTRGLDIRATEFVHRQIQGARDAGAAVILFSTDLDELSAVADRTLFMSRGEWSQGEGAIALVGGGS